jgi:hypothetical protein
MRDCHERVSPEGRAALDVFIDFIRSTAGTALLDEQAFTTPT